jgi:hypothetical protein
MKKMSMVLLIAVLSASLFAQNQGGLRGVIREVNGTVEVKQSAGAAWVPAAAGMNLDKNAVISTGFKSTALISLGETTVRVQPLSRVRLEELSASPEAAVAALFLQTGRVRARVPPSGGGKVNFQVRSPSVTASVRGTEFTMNPAGVQMLSGIVALAGSNGVPVLVGAGQSGSAGAGGALASPDLSPALPIGARTVQGAGAAPAEPKIIGRVGWYGGNTQAGD